jgi:Ni/Fe-hydrogenase 1 B-type cytochrome subunit
MATQTNPLPASSTLVNDPERIVPVYVWELPVRLAHWGLVISLVLLTVTGSYMHSPYLVSVGSRAWVMGWMRFVHELSGFFLMAIFVPRIYWFFGGNHYSSWRAWLPHTARQWASFKSMVAYYGFRRRSPFEEIGHNTLAAMAYTVVFLLLAIEFLSGLILFSVVEGNPILQFLVGWIPRIINIQWIRSAHFLIMFFLITFFIHHIYSAVLVGISERNGELESIFTGWKFVPKRLLDEVKEDIRHHAEIRKQRDSARRGKQ